jgi:hypothetical protein
MSKAVTNCKAAKKRRRWRLGRQFAIRVAAGETPTAVMRDLRPESKRPTQLAWKFMREEYVQKMIADYEQQALHEAGVTNVKIIKDIVSVKDRCMQAVPVLDHEGNETGEYQFKEMGALKALDMLGRYKRLWAEENKTQVPLGPGLQVIVQQGGQVAIQQNMQNGPALVPVNLPEPA